MYLEVVLGLVAAFGYIRFDKYEKDARLARQALVIVGAISLLVMLAFCIFIICHQASKGYEQWLWRIPGEIPHPGH